MKVEQILDEIQASLTKLREHYRKTETTTEDIARQVPLHYCTCPTEIPCPVHDRNYQELKEKITETAGECTCTHRILPDPDCLQHGWEATYKEQKATYDRLHRTPARTRCNGCGRVSDIIKLDQFWTCPFCTPDLPLNARVAKALGHACWTDQDGKWRSHMGRFIPNGVEYPFVPDYPNDLVAARDAFDLYFELQCRKIDDHFDYHVERFYVDGWKWRVRFGFADKSVVADSQEEGLCLAIVAHAEQQ